MRCAARGGIGGVAAADERAPRVLLPDDARNKHLKAVLTIWHEAKGQNEISYDVAIERAKKKYPDLQTTKGTVSTAISAFKKENDGMDPRRFSLAELLSSVVVKTIGRGDTLSEAQLQQARKMFDVKAVNFKASPTYDDWGRILAEVAGKSLVDRLTKFGGYSFPFLREMAKIVAIRPLRVSPATAARILAVGDYRNHISCAATWLAATRFHSIAPACMYSMDDTKLILEMTLGKIVTCLQSKENIKESKEKTIGFSVAHKEGEVPMNCKPVKLLAVVGGAGQCPCKIIKIVSDKVTEPSLTRLYKDDHTRIYLHALPAEGLASRHVGYAAEVLRKAVLPAIKADMRRLASQHVHPSKVDEMGDSIGSEATKQDRRAVLKSKYGRAILTFDGDYPQLQAIIQDGDGTQLAREFLAAGIELFKWAGGCSGQEQPLDRGRCFFCLKAAVRNVSGKNYMYRDVSEHATPLPDWVQNAEAVLRKVLNVKQKKGNAEFNTFWKFIVNFDDICSFAFRPSLVRQSFQATGLIPFDPTAMLSSYCFYKSLIKFEPNAITMIKTALPILVEEAAHNGFPHDDSIDRELWGLFSKVADPKYMKKKTPDMPVNHQRCIWLTNENWLAEEWRKREAAEAEKDRVRVAAEEKANAKRRRQEEKEAKAEAKRQAALVYEESEWEPDWVGVPCCYVKSDGGMVFCGSQNKNKYSHLGSVGHKRFLDEIRPLETARRNPGVLQQFIQGVAAGVGRLFGGGHDSESEGGESDCSSSSSGDADEGGMTAAIAAIGEGQDQYPLDFQHIFNGDEQVDIDVMNDDDDEDNGDNDEDE